MYTIYGLKRFGHGPFVKSRSGDLMKILTACGTGQEAPELQSPTAL